MRLIFLGMSGIAGALGEGHFANSIDVLSRMVYLKSTVHLSSSRTWANEVLIGFQRAAQLILIATKPRSARLPGRDGTSGG
jgi:hypothetical protein